MKKMFEAQRGNDKRVVFTLAPSFHGATLLSLLLSNHSDVASLGDTNPPHTSEQVCGCGELLSECHFWQEALEAMPERGREFLLLEHPFWFSNLGLNKAVLLVSGLLMNKLSIPYSGEFSEQYRTLQHLVLGYYNKNIFLDGSKNIYRYLFVKAAGFEVAGVIHLVRDPRAFVASTKKNMNMDVETSIKWYNFYHNQVRRITRTLNENVITIRYEDVVDSPDFSLSQIQKNLNINDEQLMHSFAPNLHWVGNTSLFNFDGTIHKNEKWRDLLSYDEQSLILNKTSSLSNFFGYHED